MPWKRFWRLQFQMIWINNLWSEKSKFIWNSIIQILSSSMEPLPLQKPFTLFWSFAILEIFMNIFWNREHFLKKKFNRSFVKFAVLSNIFTTRTLFTETSRPKTSCFMKMWQKFVILDGQVRDNTQENPFVEHLPIFHQKSSKTRFMTRKLMCGAWEYWHLS